MTGIHTLLLPYQFHVLGYKCVVIELQVTGLSGNFTLLSSHILVYATY